MSIGAAVAASLLIGGVGLAACGSSAGSASNGEAAKPAAQVLRDARAATESLSSVAIGGTIVSKGSSLSLHLVDGHHQGGGTVSDAGESFDLVLHAPDLYVRADTATFDKIANSAAAKLLANKWLQTTSTNASFGDYSKLLDLPSLLTELQASGKLVKGKVTTFHGVSAIPVIDQGGNHGTLYVAATGKPYILGIVGGGSNSGEVRFTEDGTATVPARPAGAVDLQKLEQGAG